MHILWNTLIDSQGLFAYIPSKENQSLYRGEGYKAGRVALLDRGFCSVTVKAQEDVNLKPSKSQADYY